MKRLPHSGPTGLSTRSRAYALSVLNRCSGGWSNSGTCWPTRFRASRSAAPGRRPWTRRDPSPRRAWKLVRTVADGLEWSYGWQADAARRLRFLIDFSYGTGLRAGELVHATRGSIEVDAHGDRWLRSDDLRRAKQIGGASEAPVTWTTRAGRSLSICTESTKVRRELVLQVLVAVGVFAGRRVNLQKKCDDP